MQYLTTESRTLAQALLNSIRGALSLIFWLSSLVGGVYLVALFNDHHGAVDMLAYGVSDRYVMLTLIAYSAVFIVTVVAHIGLFYRPSVRAGGQALGRATEIIAKPYRQQYAKALDFKHATGSMITTTVTGKSQAVQR